MSRALTWLLVMVALAPATAGAQAVQLDHYRAAETSEDGFAISRPTDLGHLRFGARLDLDYALNPLVYEARAGDASTESASVVEHQLAAQLGVALGLFDRAVLFAGLPVNLAMEGSDVAGQPRADGTSVGDLRLGARGRIWGEADDAFAIAASLTFTLPTAQGVDPAVRFAGEDGVSVHPELQAEVRPGLGVRVDVNLGARLRATDRARFVGAGLVVGHELTWGVGVTVPVVEALFEATLEAYGSTPFESFGERNASPVEALLGARLLPLEGLSVGLAGGLGLSRGYGAPDLRGVLTVGWADDSTSALRPPLPPDGSGGAGGSSGGSGDGAAGDRDASDARGGGVGDARGEAADGARSPGTEGRGPGGRSDRDGDGIVDAEDGAPDDPEDPDGFADDDGVPDHDNDGDGVLDVDDGCPLAPGAPAEHGCPASVRVDEATGRIVILDRVEFETNRADVLPESEVILEQVRAVLAANPQLRRVLVEGHTDDRGRDEANLDLSVRRVRSVIAWLVERGVAAERLTGQGCGELHPIETNRSADGRRSNRRVELHIVDPAPPDGARALEGCRDVD